MDIKTQEYHARLSGFGIKESYTIAGPLAMIYPMALRFMHSEIQLHGKHGDKRWNLEIQSEPFTQASNDLAELDRMALAMFQGDIVDDSPLSDETAVEYRLRLSENPTNTTGYIDFMVNEHFNPEANAELKSFRADSAAIRFLELDAGWGKDELADEYMLLRNQLKAKYATIWPTLTLRRS